MNAPFQQPRRMTAQEFVAWAEEQPSGRYELFDGAVSAMAPERASHARTKVRVFDSIRDAIRVAGATCEALLDGVGFDTGEQNIFIPDVVVRCGEPLPGDASVFTDPVIVVEVLSPSTQNVDLTIKLDRYFRSPTLQHYLLVRADGPPMIHHRRTPDGIATTIVQPGPLRLDPPGITVMLD